MNYDLVGIGNALVDIEVRVEDAFIEEHALTKGGMKLSTSEEQTLMLDYLQDQSTKIASGGSAANTVHGISVLGTVLAVGLIAQASGASFFVAGITVFAVLAYKIFVSKQIDSPENS